MTQICPYPPNSGGATKTFNILKHLGSQHEVSLLTFIRRESEVASLAHLAKHCRRIDFCLISRSRALDVLHAARSLWNGTPFITLRDNHPHMREKVSKAIEDNPDLIYADHLQMAQYVPQPAPCPVLLDEHNVEWRVIERFASVRSSLAKCAFASIEWRKLKKYELEACRKADIVLTVTPEDGDTLLRNGVAAGKVTVLPIGVDTEYFHPLPASPGSSQVLTFGAMSWPPNADAVMYFCRAIYPLVKQEVPTARFVAVGANPPSFLRRLAARDPSITLTDYVDDVRKASLGTAGFVVPLRIGGGMRVKILDAMALGLPVVSTSVGCEGIAAKDGTHILTADTPEDFARAVVHLLEDPTARERLGAAGRALVEAEYAWPSILSRLDEILDGLHPRP